MSGNDALRVRTKAISKSRERDDGANKTLISAIAALRKGSRADEQPVMRKGSMAHRMQQIAAKRAEVRAKSQACLDSIRIAYPRRITRNDVSVTQSNAAGFANLVTELKAHREQLASLQATLKYCQDAHPGSEECPICLEALLLPDTVTAKCGHMFHKKCIRRHLSRGVDTCPLCRKYMGKKDLVSVMNGIPEKKGEGDKQDVKRVLAMVKDQLKQVDVERALKRIAEREKDMESRLKKVVRREEQLAEKETMLVRMKSTKVSNAERRKAELEEENSTLREIIKVLKEENEAYALSSDG